jgi:hypothetical protein
MTPCVVTFFVKRSKSLKYPLRLRSLPPLFVIPHQLQQATATSYLQSHTLYLSCTQIVPSMHTHSTFNAHTHRTLNARTAYLRCTHSVPSNHTQRTLNAHTHTVPSMHIHTSYLQCTHTHCTFNAHTSYL